MDGYVEIKDIYGEVCRIGYGALYAAQKEMEQRNLEEDARRHIVEYFETMECATKDSILDLVIRRFEDNEDCNIAENDLWEISVHDVFREMCQTYLNTLKER